MVLSELSTSHERDVTARSGGDFCLYDGFSVQIGWASNERLKISIETPWWNWVDAYINKQIKICASKPLRIP
jgi:hypothetical protein